MAISTGWTLDYVGDNVDLPRLATLNKYWRKHPPIHVLFAAYVGYKEPGATQADAVKLDDETADIASFLGNIGQMQSIPKPVAYSHGD